MLDNLPYELKYLIYEYCLPRKEYERVLDDLKREAKFQNISLVNSKKYLNLLPCLINIPHYPTGRSWVYYGHIINHICGF